MLPAAKEEMLSPLAPSSAWSDEEIFSFATGVGLAALGTHEGAYAAQGKKPHQRVFPQNRELRIGEAWAKWSQTHQDSETWWRKTASGSALDANGNTLSDPSGKQYSWDFENRLTQVVNPGIGTTAFRYDPFGRRIQKNGPLGTTNYLNDARNPLEELDASGNVLAKYTQGSKMDEPLAELRLGATSYYQQDGIGSSTSLSAQSGTVTNTYTYDSFGRLMASTGTITNPFQYTSREFDQETGLYYYRARYLDSSTGRFINEDPLSFEAGPNYYSYADNNPILFIDPTGLVTFDFNFNYNHLTFWDSLWEAGGTSVHYRWHGTCTKMCDDKWKLNLTLSVTFDVNYSSDSNLDHELGHAYIAESFFNQNFSHYEAFEKIFGSEAECKRYLQHGLNNDVRNQLQTDQPVLDKQQNNYDGFWGWIFD